MYRHASIPFSIFLLVLIGCGEPAAVGDDGSVPTPPRTDGQMPPGDDDGGNNNNMMADSGVDGGDEEPQPAGWHRVNLPSSTDRVTGIYCTSPTACVLATENSHSTSHVYATDGESITATLVTADDDFASSVGVIGSPSFIGLSKVGDRLIARLAAAGHGFVSATGDYTSPASWTVEAVGSNHDAFALNAQYGFGTNGSRWLQFRHRIVYAADAAPGPSTPWREVWAPAGTPPVPANLATLRAADPSICDSEPGYSEGTRPTQSVHVAPDLGIVIQGANTLNQTSTDETGVCISTDGGDRFHLAPFPEVADEQGPITVACRTNDHCVAFGGAISGETYAFVSRNATQGKDSTWTRATIPAHTAGWTFPRFAFFAPGSEKGWVVGSDDNEGFLWTTTDGGMTWTNATSQIASLTDRRLWSGFALDEERILLGGEGGVLLVSY